MGRRDEYLESDPGWHDSLTREERLERWPWSASFGLALSGKAARALAAADRAVAVAEAAKELVLYQAIYALLDEGESVREIAGHLGISKSTVGRIVKHLSGTESRGNVAILGPQGAHAETRQLVLDAWQFSDPDSVTDDHPRGTREVGSIPARTNFGGLNG